jgi:hypothetical protein
MTNNGCEQESLVVAATRSGESTVELANHLASCAACAETKYVTLTLLQHAAMMSAGCQPRAPQRIWRKMQERRQQFALSRATRGLTAMWVLATVYFLVLLGRYLPAVWHTHSADMALAFSSLSGMVLVGIEIAVVSIALGSLSLLFIGRRIDFPAALN